MVLNDNDPKKIDQIITSSPFSGGLEDLLIKPNDKSQHKNDDSILTQASINIETESSSLETEIWKIHPIKLRYIGFGIYSQVSMITLGIFTLVMYWFPKLRYKLTHQIIPLKSSKELLVITDDGIYTKIPLLTETVFDHNLSKFIQAQIFKFHLIKYFYSKQQKRFIKIKFDLNGFTHSQIRTKWSNGLNNTQVAQMFECFGVNQTSIPIKPVLTIFFEEVFSFFYIFQLFAIIVWFYDSYVSYAVLVMVMSLVTVVMTIYEIRKGLSDLNKMSIFKIDVEVYRDNVDTTISSENLVPGDIIKIPDNSKIPCDILLLSGSCIINESMLTGEAIPVIKKPITNSSQKFSELETNNILFSGTNCLKIQADSDDELVLGIVMNPGFITMKGQLIRSILYPKKGSFKFEKDSNLYLLVLGFISLLIFGYFGIFIAPYDSNWTPFLIFIKGMEIITTCVPATLPLMLVVGIEFSLSRLKKKKIFCINPSKVNIAGRVKVVCFDKTGTLTEDCLEVNGYRLACHQDGTAFFNKKFENILPEAKLLKSLIKTDCIGTTQSLEFQCEQVATEIMACCHWLTYLNDELIGDPLDIEMLTYTGWTQRKKILPGKKFYGAKIEALQSPTKQFIEKYGFKETRKQSSPTKHPNMFINDIAIIRRFEFGSNLQRMSVITKKMSSPDTPFRLFQKGSPEKVKELSLPATVPKDFHKILTKYTKKGYRVQALAFKNLDCINSENDIQNQIRDDLEYDQIFCGLLIMENKLKPETKEVIEELNESLMKSIMITGDNVLTAINVAKKSGIVKDNQRVFLGDIDENDPEAIKWIDTDSSDNKNIEVFNSTDIETQEKKVQLDQHIHIENELINTSVSAIDHRAIPCIDHRATSCIDHKDDFVYAVSGRAFNLFLGNFAKQNPTKLKNSIKTDPIISQFLEKCLIYARVAPDEKAQVVSCLQQFNIEKRALVSFCGDGANDCCALKTADVGVSLSQSEASIAAPFTSNITNISAVIEVCKEGRCALTTATQSVKFLTSYSVLQSVSLINMHKLFLDFGDNQYIFMDLLITFPLSVFMCYHGPYHKLSKYLPSDTLISVPVFVSLGGNIILVCLFETIGIHLVTLDPYYVSPKTITQTFGDVWGFGGGNVPYFYENTVSLFSH